MEDVDGKAGCFDFGTKYSPVTKQVSTFRNRLLLKGSLDTASQGAPTSLCRSLLSKGVRHVR
jgi:hypothetical protein